MLVLFSFSFCDTWWLAWLLPFLLGLGIGWLLWSKFKSMVADLNNNILNLNSKVKGLEVDLLACKSARMEAEGNVSMLRGRMREMEASGSSGIKGAVKIAAGGASAVITSVAGLGAESTDKWFTVIGNDKLQVIEGIGPKMEEILRENGIMDFNALAATTPEALRTILNKYGDKYRIIDPNTWPKQAALADNRKWADLIALQKTLDTGRSDTPTDGHTDSKLEKWLIKAGVIKKWAQDDLKAVEGIGPKIEILLQNAGIKTWRALAETPVTRIQEILDAAGSRYALAEPGTWPKQSELAADGKWDELQSYQDALNAGKPKK